MSQPRPLWEAALRAQAQRVLETPARKLPKCGGTERLIALHNCRYCSAELAIIGRPNKSGVCGSDACQARKRKDKSSSLDANRTWIKEQTEEERQRIEERKRRLIAVAQADHAVSREALAERFGLHVDQVWRILSSAGIKLDQPWWYGMRDSVVPGPPANPSFKVG